MPVVCLGGMEGRFRLGKTEDQPSVTGVHGREPKYVTKEVAVGLCVLTVDDHMRAVDHRILLLFTEFSRQNEGCARPSEATRAQSPSVYRCVRSGRYTPDLEPSADFGRR